MSFKEFWLKLKTAIEAGIHRFVMWFQLSVKPDLLEFMNDNKDLAMEVVLDVARELADATGSRKREEAVRRITQQLISALPHLKITSSWINLLVEIAVTVLKSQGKM